MNSLLSKPWMLAVLALLLMLGTQFAALKLSWSELFPEPEKIGIIHPADPQPLHYSFSSEAIMQMKQELERRLGQVESREQELGAFEARLNADRAGRVRYVHHLRSQLAQYDRLLRCDWRYELLCHGIRV